MAFSGTTETKERVEEHRISYADVLTRHREYQTEALNDFIGTYRDGDELFFRSVVEGNHDIGYTQFVGRRSNGFAYVVKLSFFMSWGEIVPLFRCNECREPSQFPSVGSMCDECKAHRQFLSWLHSFFNEHLRCAADRKPKQELIKKYQERARAKQPLFDSD